MDFTFIAFSCVFLYPSLSSWELLASFCAYEHKEGKETFNHLNPPPHKSSTGLQSFTMKSTTFCFLRITVGLLSNL